MRTNPARHCRNLYAFIRLRLGSEISDREIARRWRMEWKSFSAFKHGMRQVPRIAELESLATVLNVDAALVFEVARGVPAERIHGLLSRGDKQALGELTLTGLREAHQAAESERQRFHAAWSRVGDAVFTMDVQGRFQDVNAGLCALTQYRADDLLSKTMFDLLPAGERAALIEQSATVYREGATKDAIFTLETRSGGRVLLDCGMARILDGTDNPIGIQCIGRDITEKMRLQRELSQQAATLRSTFDAVPAACLLFGRDGTILLANQLVETLTEWTASELVGRNAHDVFGAQTAASCPVTRAFISGRTEQQVSRMRSRRGDDVFVHRTAGPVLDANGDVERVVEILVDVSEQLRHGHPQLAQLWGEQLFSSAGDRAEAEKRRFIRVGLTLNVGFRAGRRRGFATTRNLSTGGLFLQTDAKVSVGSELFLELRLPGVRQPIQAKGMVVWRQSAGRGTSPGLGIRFEELEAPQSRAITRYIGELATRTVRPEHASADRATNRGALRGRRSGERRRRT